jgi:hypothetical protein
MDAKKKKIAKKKKKFCEKNEDDSLQNFIFFSVPALEKKECLELLKCHWLIWLKNDNNSMSHFQNQRTL